jgi:Spy/CpxP family protein refolding chaperone
MKRSVFLLLAVSLGLNGGFIGAKLASRHDNRGSDLRPGPRPGQLPPRPPQDPEALLRDHVEGVTRHLDLTAEQQQAVHDALLPHMSRLVGLHRQVHELEGEVSTAFSASPLDQDRFWKLVRETSRARAEIDSVSAVMLMAEAAVFTPAQRVKFAEVAPLIYVDPARVGPRGERPPRTGGRESPRGR